MNRLQLVSAAMAALVAFAQGAESPMVNESARDIPIAYDVDVVVVGGSTGAVAAAAEAARAGAKVFLAAPRPYLGEDMCGTLRLWLEAGEEPRSALAKAVYADSAAPADPAAAPPLPAAARRPPTPMQVKRGLDQALLEARVEFLFGCYPTDVLRGADGRPAGIVMANRSGRQAVLAKVIIDATDRAALARMAGAEFGPYPAGPQTFQRIVIGGEPRLIEGSGARVLEPPVAAPGGGGKKAPAKAAQPPRAVEYTLHLSMKDGSFASFAAAEQAARDLTFTPAQLDESEVLFQVPPDPMRGRKSAVGAWPGAAGLDLGALQPAGVERLYVLGGCADMPREAAARLLRPIALMEVGERVGRAAAEEAKRLPRPAGAHLPGRPASGPAKLDVREVLVGVRPVQTGLPTVRSEARGLPVLGEYDVVVVGGGTGGAPAGIGAARRGARTLVVEYLHGLGGVGTLGLITKYYHGNRVGFTAELDAGVASLGAPAPAGKMEWYRREIRKAGGDIWFGVLGCGALVEGGRVIGVVVATPEGRGAILARAVVDSTGNADIAIAAGAPYDFIGAEDAALQGVGLPPRNLGAGYTNTDYAFVDEADMVDVWDMFVTAREKYAQAWDLGQLIDTRERRRIVGDVVLSPLDIINERTWPDTVVITKSDFDSHGFTVHPLFLLKAPGRAGMVCRMPYRALLPKGLDGILVTGLAVSAHRDAIPIVRMQPDIQNEGYAAGVAAAMVAPSAGSVRGIDIRGLQTHLVEKGILPEEVLKETDSYPLPPEKVAEAVRSAGSTAADHAPLAVILAQPQDALPLLRTAYAAAQGDARLAYAHILAMMGDPRGAETLLGAVRAAAWDKGWNYRGMGQYGASISPLDSLIIALGRTREPRAVPVLLEKLAQLANPPDFSHCRALAMAFEAIGSPDPARPLAEFLARPGMSGHAVKAAPGSAPARGDRNSALRELVLARALYRSGDYQGAGEKILRAYAADPQGLYARHAQAVLDARSDGARAPAGKQLPAPPGAANPAAGPAGARRVHVFVSGGVQGVGFRMFIEEHAADLGLAGWVKNLADGRVEAVAQGDAAAVAKWLDLLKRGPPAAEVKGLEVRPEPPRGDLKGFEIRY